MPNVARHTTASDDSSSRPEQQRRQQPPEQLYDIKPLHVLLLGGGILVSGVFLTGSLTYRQAGKQLAAEGIDARARRLILPHALKALAGSLLLTGLAAGGAFWLMEGAGVVQRDSPISSSALATAVDMVLRPAAISQQLAREQRQHIGADQGASGQAATAAAGQTAALASRGQQQPQQPQ